MPSFCRHNRLIQNCPICAREQSVELRPVVSSSAPRTAEPTRTARPRTRSERAPSARGNLTIRRVARGSEDGYRSPLVPGLKSSADAERLASELGFAARRLSVLQSDPPGLYREVAEAGGDIEQRA